MELIARFRPSPDWRPSRRQFPLRGLPVFEMCSLGRLNSLACGECAVKEKPKPSQHKFSDDSGMSYREVFDFAFKRRFIESNKFFGEMLDKEKYLEMLARASAEAGEKAKKELAEEEGARITQKCLKRGLSVNIVRFPGSSSVWRMAPPLTVILEEFDRGLVIIEESIKTAIS